MPELPEVENMRLALNSNLKSTIIKVYLSQKKLRIPVNISFKTEILNKVINSITRKGKFLVFSLSDNTYIIMHAGMSGYFKTYNCSQKIPIDKHDHMVLYLNNNMEIRYNDVRRFGCFISLVTKDKINTHPIFKNIGIEALATEFNAEYLFKKLQKVSLNIKTTLLNQKIVAGIGNIYASEVLFCAKISPQRVANSLTKIELQTLTVNIKEVLAKAIILGGSTLKDYRKPSGEIGGFQNHFVVYSRENQLCTNKNCTELIRKIVQNSRATYFCVNCQK